MLKKTLKKEMTYFTQNQKQSNNYEEEFVNTLDHLLKETIQKNAVKVILLILAMFGLQAGVAKSLSMVYNYQKLYEYFEVIQGNTSATNKSSLELNDLRMIKIKANTIKASHTLSSTEKYTKMCSSLRMNSMIQCFRDQNT